MVNTVHVVKYLSYNLIINQRIFEYCVLTADWSIFKAGIADWSIFIAGIARVTISQRFYQIKMGLVYLEWYQFIICLDFKFRSNFLFVVIGNCCADCICKG